MKILIVDDSKAMRMIVIRTLRQAGFGGHELVEATNGAEGLAAVTQGGFDVVLSDWNMPQMNGIDFLKATRAAGSTVPFGFVTSEGTPAMRQQANEAGANFLIAKPFTAESFGSALKGFIKAAA
jgi:two-component system, chemotaxis family, chemotaxis protein CheY